MVKIDIENSEWKALETMLAERQLDTVRQLLIEYHRFTELSHAVNKTYRHFGVPG